MATFRRRISFCAALLASFIGFCSASLPVCNSEQCEYWLEQAGNVTKLNYGEFVYAQFFEEDVTGLWQIAVCGDVEDYSYTYGEFEVFVVDTYNLAQAIGGKPFHNCSCADLEGEVLGGGPVKSSCVANQDEDTSNDALQCDSMDTQGDVGSTCTAVLVRCVSPSVNGTGGCRLGLSAMVVIPDPFDAWWSFEYIPIVFGFCLLVVFISIFSRHIRRHRQRVALRRYLNDPNRAALLDNEVGGPGGYNSGTVVAEGTIVDEDTLPSNTFIAGTPGSVKPTATYYHSGPTEDEAIYAAEQASDPVSKAQDEGAGPARTAEV